MRDCREGGPSSLKVGYTVQCCLQKVQPSICRQSQEPTDPSQEPGVPIFEPLKENPLGPCFPVSGGGEIQGKALEQRVAMVMEVLKQEEGEGRGAGQTLSLRIP